MRGVFLPGNSTTEIRDLPDPEPGPGQVLLAMRASTICGSDIRAIYREHLQGDPAEMYQGVVAGHEPAGEVVAVGPGAVRLKVGDRVCVYHISGCGQCDDCVRGYQISCSSPQRAAYGWQRDGGHADLILAEERDCIVLPDFVTFLDGACVACGFGTAYEGLLRANVSGRDALAVVGLGPVGLAAGLLGGKLGAVPRVGPRPQPGASRSWPFSSAPSTPRYAPDEVDAARASPRRRRTRRHRLLGQRARPEHRDRPGPRARAGRPCRRRQRAARARGQPHPDPPLDHHHRLLGHQP